MKIKKPLDSQFPQLRKLWIEAFGDTEAFLDTFETTAFSPNRCRCITINDEIVAALYWFDCTYETHKLAYIYAVATDATYRGQGLCHKLMDNTHTHLKNLGYAGAVLVPGSDNLFHFYEDMGYQTCCHIKEFSCSSSDAYPAEEDNLFSVQRINKTQFSHLRKTFLPANAVLQESENLDFLESMAQFYAGKNFLLTARQHQDSLFGMELLGNTSVAPNILRTLGCKKGTFRTPGTGKPFAMYYPLTQDISAPCYFAFAFD